MGVMLANRIMLVPQIIDKHRDAGLIFFEYPPERFALATLVGVDRRVDADGLQLRGARRGARLRFAPDGAAFAVATSCSRSVASPS